MKTLAALALSLSFIAGATLAADASVGSAGSSAKACHKEATAKNLHGDARAKFMKDCKAGKTSS